MIDGTTTTTTELYIYSETVNPPALYRAVSPSAFTDSISIFNELTTLLSLQPYNGSEWRVTTRAYESALELLSVAGERIILPMPTFTPDGESGIDIEWESNGRHLALSISGENAAQDFISWRESQGRYEGAPASQELLNRKLQWLSQ